MAKRLTAFVIDVGPAMQEREEGTEPGDPSPLEKTVSDLTIVLQRKIFAEEGKAVSGKSEVCIILFGTDETDNQLAKDNPEYYKNISLAKRLTPANWELVEWVTNDLPSSETPGDFMEAIVVAVDHLHEAQELSKKPLQCDVVVFSNLKAHFGGDQLDEVSEGLKRMDIELKIIGPHFESRDDSQGTKIMKGKIKTLEQRDNEGLIDEMLRRGVSGGTWSFEDVASLISHYEARTKVPRPMNFTVELGTSFGISCSLYNQVAKAKVNDGRPWKEFYAQDPSKTIQRDVSYVLNNDSRDEIEKEDRLRMWSYGSKLVPVTQEDLDSMKLECDKGLKLLGFVSLEEGKTKIPPYLWTGDTVKLLLPRKDDPIAAKTYQALARSMLNQNAAMLLRYVFNARSKPRLVLAVPSLRCASEFGADEPAQLELLHFVQCPFAEDLRDFQFPSLNQDRWQPSEEEEAAVDELLEAYDLKTNDDDADSEFDFEPESTLNPLLQRMYHSLSYRAILPDRPLPTFKESDRRRGLCLEPRPNSLKRAEVPLSKIKSQFGLTRTAKKKEKRRGEDIFDDGDVKVAKIDGANLSVTDLITSDRISSIGISDPIGDFETLISRSPDSEVSVQLHQLVEAAFAVIVGSVGDTAFGLAVKCLEHARRKSVERGEFSAFNDFMRHLKNRLRAEGLSSFWATVECQASSGTLDLISRSDVTTSDVDPTKSKSLFQTEASLVAPVEEPDEDDEDLFDMM